MPRPKGSPNKITAEIKERLRQAIITSYNRPVLYNNIVLYKGSRLIRFR